MGRIICIALLRYPLNLFPLVYLSFWVKTKKMEKLNFYLHLISSKYQSICIQLEVKICKFLLIWICRMQKEDCLRLNVLSKSKWDPLDIDDFFLPEEYDTDDLEIKLDLKEISLVVSKVS